jgi:hypothetical protein
MLSDFTFISISYRHQISHVRGRYPPSALNGPHPDRDSRQSSHEGFGVKTWALSFSTVEAMV